MFGWTFANSNPPRRRTTHKRRKETWVMEIILVEDIAGVGEKGAVVNVKPGYARNYLLPRKLAILASANAGNLYKELQRQRAMQEDKRVTAARLVASRLSGVEVN